MTNSLSVKNTASTVRKPPGLRTILYLASVRVFYFLCGLTWFQRMGTKRRQHAAMVGRFLKETNFPPESWTEIIRKSLFANLLEQVWGSQLIEVAPLVVQGLEHIEAAQALGRGMILARFHQKMASPRASSPLRIWLERQSFKPQFAVADRREISNNIPEEFSNARDMIAARRILRKGGVVQILPDGEHGLHGVRRDFYAYQRVFRTGFAELALATQASVVPICLHFNSDGALRIKIFPAFRDARGETQEERIADLVDMYVSLLDEFWKTYPYLLVYHYMKKQMQWPRSGTDPSKSLMR